MSVLFLLAALLIGCTGLQQTKPSDDLYFRSKATQCFGDATLVKDVVTLSQNGRLTIVVNMRFAAEREEEMSLLFMHSMLGDTMVPLVDEVCVAVAQRRSISLPRQLKLAAVQGVINGLTGIDLLTGPSADEEVSTFSCILSRDDLIKRKEPRVVIRNGFFVSGPYTGQSTDSLWLQEKKIVLPKKVGIE